MSSDESRQPTTAPEENSTESDESTPRNSLEQPNSESLRSTWKTRVTGYLNRSRSLSLSRRPGSRASRQPIPTFPPESNDTSPNTPELELQPPALLFNSHVLETDYPTGRGSLDSLSSATVEALNIPFPTTISRKSDETK